MGGRQGGREAGKVIGGPPLPSPAKSCLYPARDCNKFLANYRDAFELMFEAWDDDMN